MNKKIIWIILIIVVAGSLAGGVYWQFVHKPQRAKNLCIEQAQQNAKDIGRENDYVYINEWTQSCVDTLSI